MIGFASGYALKKLVKLGLIIGGTFALGVMGLSYSGIARIDWQKAEYMTRSAAYNASQQVYHVLSNAATQYMHSSDSHTLPMLSASGFVVGLIAGLRHG